MLVRVLDESDLADQLTAAQCLFAHDHGADPVLRSDRDTSMIFMYRSEEIRGSENDPEVRVFRWLVDRTGGVVDSATFRRSLTAV